MAREPSPPSTRQWTRRRTFSNISSSMSAEARVRVKMPILQSVLAEVQVRGQDAMLGDSSGSVEAGDSVACRRWSGQCVVRLVSF